jgi:hypothetical protein
METAVTSMTIPCRFLQGPPLDAISQHRMTLTEIVIPSLACVITCHQVTTECLHRKKQHFKEIKMEKYLEAELELVYFTSEDVISTSSGVVIPTSSNPEGDLDGDELPLVPVG